MEKLYAKDVIRELQLTVANEAKAELDREIDQPSISRRGLELAGVYTTNRYDKTIIGLATKENDWLSSLPKNKTNEALKRVFNARTPLVVISSGIKGWVYDLIIQTANDLKIPVIALPGHLSSAVITIGGFVASRLAPTTEIHGSLISVFGVGVMVIGPSGIGKSEAVLELIQSNHLFVTDDTVVVSRFGNDFLGRSSPITSGFLEARGIGLVDIRSVYGAKAILVSTRIDLVIRLVLAEKTNEVDRLGNSNLVFNVLDGSIPLVEIPVTNGRSVAALIQAATSTYVAKRDGVDPLTEIAKRIRRQNV